MEAQQIHEQDQNQHAGCICNPIVLNLASYRFNFKSHSLVIECRAINMVIWRRVLASPTFALTKMGNCRSWPIVLPLFVGRQHKTELERLFFAVTRYSNSMSWHTRAFVAIANHFIPLWYLRSRRLCSNSSRLSRTLFNHLFPYLHSPGTENGIQVYH